MPRADGTIIIDTKIQDGGFKAGTKDIESAARGMASSVTNASKQAKAALKSQANDVAAANREYAKQQSHVESLRQKMAQLAGQRLPTEAYKSAERSVESLEKKLDAAIERQIKFVETGGSLKSRTFQGMEYEIERITQLLEEARQKKSALESSGKAFTSGADTAAGQSTAAQLSQEESKLNSMGARLQNMYNGLQRNVESLNSKHRSVFASMASGLQKVAVTAREAATHLAKMAASGIASGLKKISAGMFGLNKSANNNVLTFKNLLKYGLGIRSVYALVNKLRRALVEGVTNMAAFDSSTRSAINSIASSMSQLGNAAASAAGPIIQALAPALNYIISLAIAAANAIAQLLAALGGKGVFVKATKQAKGLGAAVGGAGGAAKKAREELAAFDKLNVKKDEDDGGGGGGGGGAGAGGGFEYAEIDSRIKGIADKIKDLIKAQDWEGLGAYLASGVNYGLQKLYDLINWDNVGPKITPFITAFTETFNSLVDHIDWDLMGRTIGAGINTIVNTLDLLIEGIDWNNLGKKFGEGINGMFDEIDWEKLGETLAHKFLIIPKIVLGAVSKINWPLIGRSFAEGINGFFREIDTAITGYDWSGIGVRMTTGLNSAMAHIDTYQIGATLAHALSILPEWVSGAAKTFKWDLFGQRIGEGINGLLLNFDYEATLDGAISLVNGLLDTLINTLKTVEWKEIGETIATQVNNVIEKGDYSQTPDKIAEAIGLAIGGLGALLWGVFKVEWQKTIDLWYHKCHDEDGKFIIDGLLEGMAKAAWDIATWPQKHIYEPFIKGFMSIFGISSPSKVMEEMGNYLIEGLLKGITDLIPDLDNPLKEIYDKISTKWEEIKTETNTKWTETKTILDEKLDGLKERLPSVDEVRDAVTGAWSEIKSSTDFTWPSIASTVIGAIDSMVGKLGEWASTAKQTFKEVSDAASNMRLPHVGGTNDRKDGYAAPGAATGTVVPPRAGEFLAVLGDNNKETEIVSPLSTMRQAMLEALQSNGGYGGGGGDIEAHIYLDGKELGASMVKFTRSEKKRTGRNPLLA